MAKMLALFVIVAVMARLSAAQCNIFVSTPASTQGSSVTSTGSCTLTQLDVNAYAYMTHFSCPFGYLLIQPSFTFNPYHETFSYDDFRYVITSTYYSNAETAFTDSDPTCSGSISGVTNIGDDCNLQSGIVELYLYLQCTNSVDTCEEATMNPASVTCSGYSGSGSTNAPVSTNSPVTTNTNSPVTTNTDSPGSTTTTNSPGSTTTTTTAPGESTTAPATTKHSVASFVTPSLAGLALGIVAFFFTAYF